MIKDRNAFFREYITVYDKGLEIGPSYRPLFPKREGYNVKIIDKYTKEEIIKIYDKSHLSGDIEEVDYVHEGSDLLTIFDKSEYGSYDYIASSHNLEHLDNPVQFFIECQTLLKPSGLLLLTIPDKRFCFDFFRSFTTLKDVLIRFFNSDIVFDFINYFECLINTCKLSNCYEWTCQYKKPCFELTCPDKYINCYNFFAEMQKNTMNHNKLFSQPDYHKWVFTPSSFSYLIRCLSVIRIINFEIQYIDIGLGPSIYSILKKITNVPPFSENERLGYLFAMLRDMQFSIEFIMNSQNNIDTFKKMDDAILKKLFIMASETHPIR